MFNTRSCLASKLNSFKLFCETQNFDIIFLTETWWKEDKINNAQIATRKEFNVLRCDRMGNRNGGGCAFLINNMVSVLLPTSQNFSDEIQLISFIIEQNNRKIAIHGIYRAPEHNIEHALSFEKCIDFVGEYSKQCNEVVFMGDMNTPDINWVSQYEGNNKIYNKLLCFVEELNMSQLVNEPTHVKGNILDLIFSSDEQLVTNLTIKAPFLNSDHYSVVFSINVQKPNEQIQPFLDFKNANWDAINTKPARID